ncbi:Receptor-like kinase [Quillaja saponaria]|uniref:non-specific serine/threonine protein kinase n=1 Tax=Quillaja saponaria TaxID=32244 RepID=A0AAD7VH83_QUISA|nr:Receptor-like kinase [Quillaja saponaria]
MVSKLHHYSSFLVYLACLIILFEIPPCLSSLDTACNNQFKCGTITGGFPFWGNDRPEGCGHPTLLLNCSGSNTTMEIMNIKYRVLSLNSGTQTLRIAREDYLNGPCPSEVWSYNTTLDDELFDNGSDYRYLSLHYGCTIDGTTNKDAYAALDEINRGLCSVIVVVPILPIVTSQDFTNFSKVEEVLRRGFDVKWKVGNEECKECMRSNGACGYDLSSNQTTCYCKDQSSGSRTCSPSVFSFVVIFTIIAIVFICEMFLRKVRQRENDEHVEEFIKNQDLLVSKRYTYSDVKKMTKAFANKIGQGGYGVVYQGRLEDGRLTSHVNVVNLLGFSYHGKKKRALIYEFMSNGSLDKFIYKGPSDRLEWKTLYEIATGIARGLEYLHRGCSTRILHFDIKPHNILLDENFCPKISDFGLAKLCKRDDSAVSIIGTRGTIGYIATEVFSRNFGNVSHKSDVYSYGMMISEMGGIRKGTDVRISDTTSEAYFPHYIYKRLEVGKELRLDGVIKEEDEEISRKMILLSLW